MFLIHSRTSANLLHPFKHATNSDTEEQAASFYLQQTSWVDTLTVSAAQSFQTSFPVSSAEPLCHEAINEVYKPCSVSLLFGRHTESTVDQLTLNLVGLNAGLEW